MKPEALARFKREHVQSSAVTVVFLAIIAGYTINLIDSIPLGWGAPIPLLFGLLVAINLWYHSQHRKELDVEGKWLKADRVIDPSAIRGVGALSAKYRIKVALKAYEDKKDGAFTTGWWKGISIAVSDNLAAKLSPAQQMAVFAHELGHAVNGDILITILTKSATLAMGALQQVVALLWIWHKIFGGSVVVSADQVQSATDFYWGLFFQLMLGQVVVNFLAAVISREREQMADAFAVVNGHGEGLYEALDIMRRDRGSSSILDLVFWFIGSHPPLFLRMRDIRMMHNGDQGLIPDRAENAMILFTGVAIWWVCVMVILTPAPLLFYLAPPFLMALVWEYASPHHLESFIKGKVVTNEAGEEPRLALKLADLLGYVAFLLYAMGGVVVLYLVGTEVFESGTKAVILASMWTSHLFLIPLRSHKLAELVLLVFVSGFALLTAVALFSLI